MGVAPTLHGVSQSLAVRGGRRSAQAVGWWTAEVLVAAGAVCLECSIHA